MADQGKEQKYQKQRAFIEQLQKKNILVTVSSFKRCLQISEPKTSWLMCAYASFRGFPMRKRCSMASELPLRCWKTTSICSKCQTPVTPPDMWTGNTPRLPGNTHIQVIQPCQMQWFLPDVFSADFLLHLDAADVFQHHNLEKLNTLSAFMWKDEWEQSYTNKEHHVL